MTYRDIFIIVLLMVSIWGLSISPNQMKAIEFQPKKTSFEKKKEAIWASVSSVRLPGFGQVFLGCCPVEHPVLPLPKTVSR